MVGRTCTSNARSTYLLHRDNLRVAPTSGASCQKKTRKILLSYEPSIQTCCTCPKIFCIFCKSIFQIQACPSQKKCLNKEKMKTLPFDVPLMPNVGPCEGCRMHAKQFFLRCTPMAWATPIVVVLLPSPNGVGVILTNKHRKSKQHSSTKIA